MPRRLPPPPAAEPAQERLEDLAARAADARARANALEAKLEQVRSEASLTNERARTSRLRLLMERTTPAAARAAAQDADRRLRELSEQVRRASAAVGALERELATATREQAARTERLAVLETFAAGRDLTRSGLYALDAKGLDDLEALHIGHQRAEREKAWRSAARINKPVRPRPPGTPPQTPSPYQYQAPAPQRSRGYGFGR